MPLKASIGLSRKIGQPDYGSLGANCQLEVELDASLVGDADAFHEKIQRLYALANQAVSDQLASHSNGNGQATAYAGGRLSSGNGHNGDGRSDSLATNKQIKMINDLARRQGKSLQETGELCAQIVGTGDLYQLSKRQASAVIDQLTGKNGSGRR